MKCLHRYQENDLTIKLNFSDALFIFCQKQLQCDKEIKCRNREHSRDKEIGEGKKYFRESF